MIIPMTKYNFLVYHRDYRNFLESLRQIGVFHVKEKNDEPAELKDQLKDLSTVSEILTYFGAKPDPDKTGRELPRLLINETNGNIQDLNQLQKDLKALTVERNLILNTFGQFSKKKVDLLAERGAHFHFFSCKLNQWQDQWDQEFGAIKLNETTKKTYFVIVWKQEESPTISAQLETIPNLGVAEIDTAINELNESIQNQKNGLVEFFKRHETDLHHTFFFIKEQFQFEKIEAQGEKLSEDKFIWLETYVPGSKKDQVEKVLKQESCYFEEEIIAPEDKPPILLENNKFAKLFEPIGSLFSLPAYNELDLTPLFAPFFLLFFGFCLGDAGYGIVIILGLMLFGKKLGPESKSIVRLAQVLGLAAVGFGVITGTVFGYSFADSQLMIPQHIKDLFLGSDQLFNLSLALGGVQIIYGMVVKIINQYKQYGFVYTLSTLGWIFLVLGLASVGLDISAMAGSILSWSGVGLILLFNDPKANIFVRLGKGLWELYGITGVFGDLLSYIRLFALGLSSSILGLVINEIGLSILGSHAIAGPIFFIIFMLIGHTLNLFIASLGAFVHPMRLTFVEFYKNAGFSGGGIKYTPFKKETT